jgi:hypothetical protein
MHDFVDEKGYLVKNINELPRSVVCAISEMTEIENYNKDGELVSVKHKVKLNPKNEALKMLLTNMGGLKQSLEVTITNEQDALNELANLDREIDELKRQH